MRLFLPLFICFLLGVSCENKKPDFRKMVQGNWECEYDYKSQFHDTAKINLQFLNNKVCHFYIFQNEENTYDIQDSLIIVNLKKSKFLRNKEKKQVLKIIYADKDMLELVSMEGLLNHSYELTEKDTLRFFKTKRMNNLKIRRVSFYSSGCFGQCPSFKMEMNPNDSIKFESFSNSLEEGSYTGKSPSLFWKRMLDQATYIDFKNWKENYEAGWTDDQTCALVFETNKGKFHVSIYGDDREPRPLRNIIWYIFSNYETFELKKTDGKNVRFAHDQYSKDHDILPEVRILQFVPLK